MIRRRQIGPNHRGGFDLAFCRLELFAGLLKNTPTDWRFLHFPSLADELFEIKAGLIGKGIIP
jgi:hypothetical protein